MENIDTDIIILDVRSRQEFCNGHLCNALNVPMKVPPWTYGEVEDFKNKLWQIWHERPGRTYAVYCKLGKRSKMAVDTLRSFGASVIDLGGVENGLLKPLFEGKSRHPGYSLCYCKYN